MSIDRLRAHYGFSRMPFGKELAPGMLYRSKAHAEALARITWLIAERAMGVITGEVGAGKTVAVRAATAALDASRHALIYLAQPGTGVRGIYVEIVRALGATPCFQRSNLVPQTIELLAAEEAERGKKVVLIVDEAHLLSPEQLESLRLLGNSEMDSHSPFSCLILGQPTLRLPAPRPADPSQATAARHLRRSGPAHRAALQHRRDGPGGNRSLCEAPSLPGGTLRPLVQ